MISKNMEIVAISVTHNVCLWKCDKNIIVCCTTYRIYWTTRNVNTYSIWSASASQPIWLVLGKLKLWWIFTMSFAISNRSMHEVWCMFPNKWFIEFGSRMEMLPDNLTPCLQLCYIVIYSNILDKQKYVQVHIDRFIWRNKLAVKWFESYKYAMKSKHSVLVNRRHAQFECSARTWCHVAVHINPFMYRKKKPQEQGKPSLCARCRK